MNCKLDLFGVVEFVVNPKTCSPLKGIDEKCSHLRRVKVHWFNTEKHFGIWFLLKDTKQFKANNISKKI